MPDSVIIPGRRQLFYLAGAAFVVAAPVRPPAIPDPGIAFRLRVTVDRQAIDSSGRPSAARVQSINSLGTVIGARGRYDILTSTANGSDFDTDDRYLVRAAPGKILVVRGTESDYFERTFEQPLPGLPRSRANLDAGPQLTGATISDLSVVTEARGSTDTIEGRPTKRTRLVARYLITVKGESRGGRTIMELWTTPLAAQPVDPFERLPDGALGPGLDSVFARLNGARASRWSGCKSRDDHHDRRPR